MNFKQMSKIRRDMTFSLNRFSKMLGVSKDEIKSWKNGDSIPEKYSTFINNKINLIELVAKDCFKQIIEMQPDKNNIFLIKYNSNDDFEFADSELFNLISFYELHTFLLIKITSISKENNINILTINFEKENYVSWLRKKEYCNCSKHRSEWVSSSFQYPIPISQILFMENMMKSSCRYIKKISNMIVREFNFNHAMNAKIDIFRNILLQAIVELAEEVIFTYKRKKLIPSAVIVRALFERECLLYYLYYCTENFVKNPTKESEERLKKVIFGSKGKFSRIDSVNILTTIQKQIKYELSGSNIMELYDELSNLIHPNFNGVWDAYFNLNITSLDVAIKSHDKGNIKLTVITALNKSLGLSILWYEKIEELLRDFEKLPTNSIHQLVQAS